MDKIQAYNLESLPLLLPLSSDIHRESEQITSILAESLQEKRRFEIQVYSLSEADIEVEPLDITSGIPANVLVKLAQRFYVQGVIYGRITHTGIFPSGLGLNLHLISTQDGSVLWSVDTIWCDSNFYSLQNQDLEQSVSSLSPTTFIRNSCDRISHVIP